MRTLNSEGLLELGSSIHPFVRPFSDGGGHEPEMASGEQKQAASAAAAVAANSYIRRIVGGSCPFGSIT